MRDDQPLIEKNNVTLYHKPVTVTGYTNWSP